MTPAEITRLIDDLKNLTQRNSITPHIVANIFQQIVNLLKDYGGVVSALSEWRNYLIDENVLYSISQGTADRNDVHLRTQHLFLEDGAIDTSNVEVVIKQATTERAGVMRAQQVLDLNACKKDIKTVQNTLNEWVNTFTDNINTLQESLILTKNDVKVLQDLCDGLEEAIEFIQLQKPWRVDFPAYHFSGIVYNTNEAATQAPDVYYSVAQKKFFMLRNGSPDYDVEHNTTDKSGLLSPRQATFYIFNYTIHYWNGQTLNNYPTFEMFDELQDRVAKLEDKL